MKKLLAALLALVLTAGLISTALASTDYDSPRLKEASFKSSEWTDTDDHRAVIAAYTLLEYMVLSGKDASLIETLSANDYARITAYGTCIDIYYPLTDGKYLNLFITPAGKLSDYGVGTFTGSSSYTYENVSMRTVMRQMLDFLSP